MRFDNWLTLVACGGHLTFAFLALLRGSRSRLALPLALMCMDFFVFNGADLAGQFSGSSRRGWVVIDNTAASLLTPIMLQFMVVFVGRRRQLGWLLIGYWAAFGAIALGWPLQIWNPDSTVWARLMIALAAPLLLLVPTLLIVHLRRASNVLERGRTYLVISAFFIGGLGCLTDLLADSGLEIPRLANVGTLVAVLLLTTIALRFGLFERRVSTVFVFNAIVVASLQVLGYLAVFRFFAANRSMLILGTITVTLALLPPLRELASSWSAQRTRLEYLATLGRFAAQMAHDLKNPLAAVKGAAQFLQIEGARSGWLPEQREYVDLIVAEADRLVRVVGDYQRLGRAEAALATLQVNDLITSVVAAQTLVAPAGVTLRAAIDPELPRCNVDCDLLSGALENLIRNALDAIPDGGTITVRSLQTSGPLSVVVSVEDDGIGMNARTREKAFDDFYTTKAQGSGLGLAFVKRIAEAHGGEVSLSSEEGRGTTVSLRLAAAVD